METLLHISQRQKMLVMMAVLLAMFLSALDQTIVSTALPTIVKDFDSLDRLSWVFTAYMLTSTIIVPIYGKLSDLYGRKGLFMLSIVIFLFGSALCGMSQDINQLIIFRAIQGIGGGALMTNAFAIIADLFVIEERGKWQGIMGGVFGLSSVFGPIMGGWLTDHLSWRWNFYINMPLGVLALLGIFFLMPKIKSSAKDKSIDYMGAIYLAMGLATLLLAFTWGGTTYAWDSMEILLLFGFSFVTLSFFASMEHLVKNPILPPELFRNPVFAVSSILVFFTGMGMFGVISYIPLFAQKVIGVSATNSGSIMFPLMFGMIFASVVSGRLISKFKRYKFLALAGSMISVVAMAALSTMTAETTQFSLMLRMVLTGLGLGLTMPVFNIAVQNAFEHSKAGLVTSSMQLFRSVGGAVGVAIAGTIFNHQLAANPTDLASAIATIFFFGIFFTTGSFLLTLFLKEIPFGSQKESGSALENAGKELAIEEGNFAMH